MRPRGARLLIGAGGILEQVRLVAHCLLIEAPEGLVLLDTGFGTGDVADPGRLGKPFGALARPKLEIGETAVRQVKRLGHDPADVRHILITHLDLDHAGGLADFPDADVHVFAAELAAARSPTRREAARYVKAQWAHGPKWVEHDVDGDTWLGFDSVRVLPGLDGDVAMVSFQGHTRGHTGIALRTATAGFPLRRRDLPPRRADDAAVGAGGRPGLSDPHRGRRQAPPPQPGAPGRAGPRAPRGGAADLLARPRPARRRVGAARPATVEPAGLEPATSCCKAGALPPELWLLAVMVRGSQVLLWRLAWRSGVG